jgi:hypothetical protein
LEQGDSCQKPVNSGLRCVSAKQAGDVVIAGLEERLC